MTIASTKVWASASPAGRAFKGHHFFGDNEVGFLDVFLGCGSYWLTIFEEVTSVQLVDAEAFPLFNAWLRDFQAQDEVRETIPSINRLLEYARRLRQTLVAMAAGADWARPRPTPPPPLHPPRRPRPPPRLTSPWTYDRQQQALHGALWFVSDVIVATY
ncbi:hypothetical protein ZWY2020_033170 [Hordeum vulgare]|nr:hypothetical protein ZWY2020_033170 [Hordeum vulgare]